MKLFRGVIVVLAMLHSLAQCERLPTKGSTSTARHVALNSAPSWNHHFVKNPSDWKPVLWCNGEKKSTSKVAKRRKMTLRARVLQGWRNFIFGVSYTHNNFLRALWHSLLNAILASSALRFIVKVGHSLSPSMGKRILRLILRTLMVLSPSVSKNVDESPFVPLDKRTHQRSLLQQFLWIVVIAPICEEIEHRWLFQQIVRRWLTQTIQTPKEVGKSNGRGLEVSKAIGSFWFACCHIGNWVSPDLDVAAVVSSDTALAKKLISCAITQFFVAFMSSYRIIFPLYEKRGLMASIGAHSLWNGYSLFGGLIVGMILNSVLSQHD